MRPCRAAGKRLLLVGRQGNNTAADLELTEGETIVKANPLIAGALAALLGCLPVSGREFYMPDGTEVKLRLHTEIDTRISQVGDRFICSVEEPVRLEGIEVIPIGTRIHGRISDLRRPRRFPSRGGKLVLAFESIELPGAGTVQISGSLWDLYEPDEASGDAQLPDVDISDEGRLKAGGPRKLKRTLAVVGGAAAGGAAGATTRGGGTNRGLAGAAIGMVVGVGIALLWFRGKHVQLPAGTALIMRVDRGVTLSVPLLPPPRR